MTAHFPDLVKEFSIKSGCTKLAKLSQATTLCEIMQVFFNYILHKLDDNMQTIVHKTILETPIYFYVLIMID